MNKFDMHTCIIWRGISMGQLPVSQQQSLMAYNIIHLIIPNVLNWTLYQIGGLALSLVKEIEIPTYSSLFETNLYVQCM